MLKKLLTHGFLYSVGPQVPKLANLLVLPIITQYLTPTDYGVYGTVLAYTALFGGVKSLGFDVLLVNTFFKKKSWKLFWGRYMGGLYIFNAFFSILYYLILYLLIPDGVGENRSLIAFLIVVPSFFFEPIKMVGARYYQLAQQPRYIAITSVVSGVIVILLNLYTIAFLKMGYMGWFVSTAIGSMIVFVFYALPIFFWIKLKFGFTKNWLFWKKALKISLPTVPHQYSTYLLNSSDRLVMDQLNVPLGQIGIYNLAYIFGGYMEMFGNAIGMAVGPYLTALYNKKEDSSDLKAKELIMFLLICFIFICFLLSLWSKEAFQLLINNEDLVYAYPIAIIILMGYAYRPLYWAAISKLLYYEKTAKLWRISFLAGVLNVVLNLIFIPLYGIEAAAITTFISFIYLAVAPYYLKDFKKINKLRFYAEYWMIFIGILTIALFYIKDISVLSKSIITFLSVLTFVVYFLKSFKRLNRIEI